MRRLTIRFWPTGNLIILEHALCHVGLIVRVVNNTGPGLALQEMMYGFIMALLFITATRFGVIDCNSAIDLIVLMAGMDFTWGAIDCILFYFVDVLDQRRML